MVPSNNGSFKEALAYITKSLKDEVSEEVGEEVSKKNLEHIEEFCNKLEEKLKNDNLFEELKVKVTDLIKLLKNLIEQKKQKEHEKDSVPVGAMRRGRQMKKQRQGRAMPYIKRSKGSDSDNYPNEGNREATGADTHISPMGTESVPPVESLDDILNSALDELDEKEEAAAQESGGVQGSYEEVMLYTKEGNDGTGAVASTPFPELVVKEHRYKHVEHTWPEPGPLGLKLRQRGNSKDTEAGVRVTGLSKDASPEVKAQADELVDTVLYKVSDKEVTRKSYNYVLELIKAADHPLTISFRGEMQSRP
jgi:hypothetical protein